jgi:ligand-binding sensor domain-containing protein
MRAKKSTIVLFLTMAGCARPPAPTVAVQASTAPAVPRRPAEPPRLVTPLAGPRVAEVLTAAGEVRDALVVGGALWLATAGGLVRASMDLAEEARFTTLDGLPSNDAWALAALDDELYVATSAGVVSARLDDGRPVEATLLPLPQARAVAVSGGSLFAGTPSGLARWDGRQFRPAALEGEQVNRLLADGPRLWAATSAGVARIEQGRVTRFSKKDGLPDDFVWDVAIDKEAGGAVRVETMAGAARIEGAAVTALPGAAIRRTPILFGDGRLVIGDSGVTRLGSDGAARASLQPLGLPSPNVTALAIGDDALYVGTFDRGVAAVRRDRDDGSLSIDPVEGLIDDRVNALVVRRDGGVEELWVGTARGASRVRAGQVTHFTEADGLPDDHVNAILADADTVRLITTRGYAEITAGGLRRVLPENGLPMTRLYAAARGSDGALWLGGAHGAARFGCEHAVCDAPSWSTAHALSGELPDDYVTALLGTGDDLWIGTYSSGLARKSGRRWSVLREPELPSGWINTGALAAWHGRVWAGTVERGLIVSPPQRPGEDEGRWTSLNVADGLPSSDVTALAADDDGLWVGTRGGLARVVMPVVVGGLR